VLSPSPRLTPYFALDRIPQAAEVVRTCFLPRPTGRFTGAHFERLGGGGDRPEVADEFTAEDLVAVPMLSIPVVGDTALEILMHRRNQLHELLRQIPTDLTLAAVDPEVIGPSRPAWQTFLLLRSIRDVGPTTASKLLARKRPHLLSVYDSVVDENSWGSSTGGCGSH